MTDRRQIFGLVGSGLLILGTFLPLASVPIVGSINYFKNGQGDGVFIIGFGTLAIVFTLIKRYKLLWIPAILSIALLIYVAQEMSGSSSGIFSISMEWGWLVMFAGGILLVLAALIKAPATPSTNPEIG